MLTFGKFFREKRLALGKGFRDFCLENELDAKLISRIERDIANIDEFSSLIQKFTRILKIKPGTEEWDLYASLVEYEKTKALLPKEEMSEEELVKKLPLFTKRKLSRKQLTKLAKLIRES